MKAHKFNGQCGERLEDVGYTLSIYTKRLGACGGCSSCKIPTKGNKSLDQPIRAFQR